MTGWTEDVKTLSMASTKYAEIAKFAKDSAHWWDPQGPFAPLHKLNPARMSYLTAQIGQHYGRDLAARQSLKGLKILDIGCGGGLVCEPLARLGASVTGVDADAQAIRVARNHAKAQGLAIDYIRGDLRACKRPYDIILALEILEHVDDPQDFINNAAKHLKPGGIMIFSTLNKTVKALGLGIVAAEYILRWVPMGTHDWRKFIKPSNLAHMVRAAGLTPLDVCGLQYRPLRDEFALSPHDLSINYFLTAASS
ncbi:MAG: bifunctional 2-polyprenyl-6-hydroxyphenol methylase/3-demethylubiquinol 3-O-methyltransferase UbiG [Alphaproteobacteria bacterium]|nr:bifunctional 2-polyprenyl-6-hydroxyphenol methylase/3-demethylubiquinol 3-O-methyltransferase UbiG [Alphaproteobacteria bacterium]